MRAKRKCELCNGVATIYCESDQASLCNECDSKVHGANFLVAKHLRTLLCHVCQSPTLWTGSGPKFGPTISVCPTCLRSTRDNNNNNHNNNVAIRHHRSGDDIVDNGNNDHHSHEDGDEDLDHDDDDDDDDDGFEEDDSHNDDGDDNEDDDDDDEENQVVPWSYSVSHLR